MVESKNEEYVKASAQGRWARMRRRTWQIVEAARPGDTLSRWFDVFIIALILLNVVVVIIGTVEGVEQWLGVALVGFEVFSVMVFSIEYLARLWSSTASERFGALGAVRGRLRFAHTPMALIDLFAVLPFYLPLVGIDLRFLRALRLLRILRIFKMGRYLPALLSLKRVIRRKKEELIISLTVLMLLLIMAASLMYYAERDAQPEAFSSIPETMWWAVVTFTTVGYGDVYPVTLVGRALAAASAILGLGLFALPASILASGFQEELNRMQEERERITIMQTPDEGLMVKTDPEAGAEEGAPSPERCPHCGKELEAAAE